MAKLCQGSALDENVSYLEYLLRKKLLPETTVIRIDSVGGWQDFLKIWGFLSGTNYLLSYFIFIMNFFIT